MKDWFKYEYGYVNIDENYVYVTNSGNWSETNDLKERSSSVVAKNSFRKLKNIIFLSVTFTLFFILFLNNFSGSDFSLLLLLGIPGAAYYLYQYMRSDLGSKFKIPINKITDIKISDTSIIISFTDADGKASKEMLKNPESKGKDLLVLLMTDNLFNNPE
ncbi:MAG: hypothetical protein ACK40G_11280 [Cytophagaceae bacterium]